MSAIRIGFHIRAEHVKLNTKLNIFIKLQLYCTNYSPRILEISRSLILSRLKNRTALFIYFKNRKKDNLLKSYIYLIGRCHETH